MDKDSLIDYVLVRDENIWIKRKASLIEEFTADDFGYIAKMRTGQEILEKPLSQYEVKQIWCYLNDRCRAQLIDIGFLPPSLTPEQFREWAEGNKG